MIERFATALSEHLPGWHITWQAGGLGEIREPTLVLVPQQIDRCNTIALGLLPRYALWVFVPGTGEDPQFEQALERALLTAVTALEATGLLAWNTAQRGTLQETWSGWRIETNSLKVIKETS